jgi:hypothetical protein
MERGRHLWRLLGMVSANFSRLNYFSLEASDPTSYMVVDLNVEKALAYIKKLNSE